MQPFLYLTSINLKHMEKIKEYPNGEISVVWKPELCQHAGICVKMLPKVYNPRARPWITVENASTPELKEQVSKCPSGALTYYELKS